ncbi:MAG: hypothetical protein O3A00_06960 [Planctomycetota bacterium]|nr:hypothetical protein [Planctomycetota bacterium]
MLDSATSAFARLTKDIQNAFPDDESVSRRLEELDWSLAALWKDPPVGTSQDVGTLLQRFGLQAHVQPFLERL